MSTSNPKGRQWLVLLLLVPALLLAGCSQIELPTEPGAGPDAGAAIFTSPAATTQASAFASPLTAISTIPTPSAADKATVKGVLQKNLAAPEPVPDTILYLAAIVPGPEGTPYLAGLSKAEAPKALTQADGQFVFLDVAPGQYALILDRVYESFMLNDPASGGDLLYQVEAGQIVDLGTLLYPSLPGDGPLP